MKKIRLHLSKVSLKDDDLVCKLQGFLMEKLSDDFASFLHQQETNPYSMNLRSEREESIWTVNLLSEEAGQFVLFPDTRLIFQSLMQKYSRLVEGKAEIEEETLEFLAEHSQISSYRLKSHYFPIHGRKYPAFEGRVTIRIQGASTLKAYAQMLLRFGEYSGVGAKCSLGMGGMRIEERKT